MTTSAASVAGHGEKDKDKEKVEKRRALGRGLESLLPGPRAVAGTAAPGVAVPGAGAAKPQVPHFVRPESPARTADTIVRPAEPGAVHHVAAAGHDGVAAHEPAPAHPIGEHVSGVIRAVVDSAVYQEPPADIPGPHLAEAVAAESLDGPITIYAQAESRMPANLVVNLAISDIYKNPFQTRYVEDDEALEELADSIKVNGVVQPIMVRPAEEEGRYILILGERRLHASKKAGKTHIPAMVRRVSLQQAAEMTIIENLQREDLSALEQAEAFRVLSREFQLTQQQIGERVGLSRASVTNYMRLLKLPREVMQLLAEKRINFAEAKELLKLEGDDQIVQGALYAVKKGLSLEQIERMVLSMNGLLDPFPGMPGQVVKKTGGGGARWTDPNVKAAQVDLERLLGVRVKIRDRKGKGKIVIEYHTVDDYERVVEMIRGKK